MPAKLSLGRRSKSKNLPRAHAKKKSVSKSSDQVIAKCPKCGGQMIKGTCAKCKYSPKTAYHSRAEAKEFTVAGD